MVLCEGSFASAYSIHDKTAIGIRKRVFIQPLHHPSTQDRASNVPKSLRKTYQDMVPKPKNETEEKRSNI